MEFCFWKKHYFFKIILLLFIFTQEAFADESKIAIFYPQAKEPYYSIYQEILSGIKLQTQKETSKVYLSEFLLDKKSEHSTLIQQLIDENINKVIVLGRSGWKLAKKLAEVSIPDGGKRFQVVSGALPIRPNGISGISLITDPNDLFGYLNQVTSNVKRIHVAYSKRNHWLIKLAEQAASAHGIKLSAKEVSTTKQAIEFYQQLFDSPVNTEDAIWLPLDRVSSHDKIILPLILENAWKKEVVVFSSKPSHVKRGVLFSSYPDNASLGKQLFTMLQELKNQPQQKNFSALKSTLLAVNLRTAAHLGFKYSAQQQQDFKLTFPK